MLIEFDSTIKAFKGPTSARTEINSGDLIKEDTFLSFTKIDDPKEYFDENFYFNGKKWESLLSADLYLLNSNDAVEKDGIFTLKVTTKTRPKNKIKVVWDDTNMTCETRTGLRIDNEGKVDEGDSLTFKYKLNDNNKIITGFFTDGKDDSHTLARNQNTDQVEGCILKALLQYCRKEDDEYVLRPKFKLDDAQKITIEFGSSITCTNMSNGHTSVTSGMEISEGTSLKFQANSNQVHKWIVGSIEANGGRLLLKDYAVWCVRREWAKKVNGKYVAKVSFE